MKEFLICFALLFLAVVPNLWADTTCGGVTITGTCRTAVNAADNQTRNFVVDTCTTAYRYFKLTVSQNNGDATYTDIVELYFYE